MSKTEDEAHESSSDDGLTFFDDEFYAADSLKFVAFWRHYLEINADSFGLC